MIARQIADRRKGGDNGDALALFLSLIAPQVLDFADGSCPFLVFGVPPIASGFDCHLAQGGNL